MSESTACYTDVRVRQQPDQGLRYVNGITVYDEAMCDGQLVGRYWSPCGMIVPEMHLTPQWLRAAARQGPVDVFRLGIEGELLRGGWAWVDAGVEPDSSGLRAGPTGARQAVVTLRHATRPIEVRVCTRLDGSDWLVRWLEITNLGDRATAITSLAPMAGRLWAHRYDEHLPEGVSSPYELAYNHSTTWGHEGDLWFEPLRPGAMTFDGGRNGKSGWSRPAFWTRDLANGQTFVVEFAWSGNWQFELTCQMDEGRRQAELYYAMGMAPLADADEVLRVLAPGETLRSPAVHIGCFQRDPDAIVQSLHAHVRHTVLPQPPTGHDIEIEANHRGYLCDRENEPDLKRDIDIAADLGVELYVIDAGWFGREPNQWWRNVGDWHSGPWLEHGLEAIASYAHARGMRFGLWAEVEAAGDNSVLRETHPDWLVRRRGQPVANGRALDLAQPQVAAWVESEIVRLVERFQLDMFRLDHNHGLGLGGTAERDGYLENGLWRYYEALYGIFGRVRARFPGLVLQNCAGGGGRLDLGILQRFHNTEISDWMRQPRGMVILNGLSMALPPEMCLRTFGTEVGEHALEADLDAQLRLLALCRPIFRGIAPTLEELNPLARERIAHYVARYKAFLRPVIRDGQFYHHTPWLRQGVAAPWCVLECASPDRLRAAVVLFRYAADDPGVYALAPRGLARRLRYRVTYDNSGEVVEESGQTLMDEGLRVRVPNRQSSELLLFEALQP